MHEEKTIFFIFIIITILGLFIWQDILSRRNYDVLNKETTPTSEYLKDKGAVEVSSLKRGNGALNSMFNCGVDLGCPAIYTTWSLLITPGQEADTVNTVARITDYKLDGSVVGDCKNIPIEHECSQRGNKNNFSKFVTLRDVSQSSPKMSDSSKKQYEITVSWEYYWNTN